MDQLFYDLSDEISFINQLKSILGETHILAKDAVNIVGVMNGLTDLSDSLGRKNRMINTFVEEHSVPTTVVPNINPAANTAVESIEPEESVDVQ